MQETSQRTRHSYCSLRTVSEALVKVDKKKNFQICQTWKHN